MYEYRTQGTCSSRIWFDVIEGKVHSITFENGCNGNLKALGILAEGMDVKELIKKLKGLECHNRGTSCGDQLARAVELAISQGER